MSHSIAIPHHRPAERERGRHRHVFAVATLGLILGALGFGIAATTTAIVRTAVSEEIAAEPLVTFPPREIPREWRLEQKTVPYEHMYRQQSAPQREYVREEGDLKWRGRF